MHAQSPDADNRPAPTTITRRNLGSDVYSILWDRILNRDLHPGEKLSDLHLSEQLGVSRTPVREALHRLVQDGVVDYAPNRGFFVAVFSPVDIAEIYDLRAALEVLALKTVAARFPPSEFAWALDDLEAVAELVAHAATDQEHFDAQSRFLEVDRGFHRWLVEQAGNQRLIGVIGGLWAQISVFQKAGTRIPGWTEIAIDEHRRILRLLIEGQPEAAAIALERHIVDIKKRVLVDLALVLEPDDASPSGADDTPA